MKTNLTGTEAKHELFNKPAGLAEDVSLSVILTRLGYESKNFIIPSTAHVSLRPTDYTISNMQYECTQEGVEATLFAYTNIPLASWNQVNKRPEYYDTNVLPTLVIAITQSFKKPNGKIKLGFTFGDEKSIQFFPWMIDLRYKTAGHVDFIEALAKAFTLVENNYTKVANYASSCLSVFESNFRVNSSEDISTFFTNLVFKKVIDSRQTNSFVKSFSERLKDRSLTALELHKLLWESLKGQAPSGRLKTLTTTQSLFPSIFKDYSALDHSIDYLTDGAETSYYSPELDTSPDQESFGDVTDAPQAPSTPEPLEVPLPEDKEEETATLVPEDQQISEEVPEPEAEELTPTRIMEDPIVSALNWENLIPESKPKKVSDSHICQSHTKLKTPLCEKMCDACIKQASTMAYPNK